MKTITPFYKFRAEAGDEPTGAELLIFDVIGDWEDLGEIGAKAFARDLSALPKSVKRLDIHINSPGGSVSEAMAIYSRLADHQSNKNIYVDGIAASAATLVAMVGHKIFIRANATMMIHLPMGIVIGNAEDMRTTIAALDSITESMLNLYSRRTGGEREGIRALMAAETWMSAEKAVEKGFADEVRGVVKAAAMVGDKRVMFNGVTFDLSRFHNVPAFNATNNNNEREAMNPTAENPNPTAPPDPGTGNPPKPGTGNPPPTPGTGNPPGPSDNPNPPEPPGNPNPPPAAASAQSEFDKGVQRERERIAALQKYDRPATHALITAAIADGRTVNDLTEALFTAMENAAGQQARRSDASNLDNIPPSDAENANKDGQNAEEFGGRLKKAVQNVLNARGGRRIQRQALN